MMSMSYSIYTSLFYLLTVGFHSYGASNMAHLESPGATKQENINLVSLRNGRRLYPLRLSPSHASCDQRIKARGCRPTT